MVTYTNTAANETYQVGLEVLKDETLLEAAWGRGLRVVCKVKGWNAADVFVSVK